MFRWIFWLITAIALAITARGDIKSPAPGDGPDEVLVTGASIRITRGQLDDQFQRMLLVATASQQVIPEKNRDSIKALILERLIFTALTTNRAKPAEIVIAKAESANFVKGEKQKYGDGFEKHLKDTGATEDGLAQQNFAEVLSRMVVEREVKAQVKIPTADLKSYYEEDMKRWDKPEIIRVAHILLSTQDSQTGQKLPDDKIASQKRKAEEALDRAQKGDDFGGLVQEYSDDAPSKARGGEYTIQRGQMPKEFEDASFALKPGELSGVVKTEYGFHIIKALGRIPGKTFTFEEVESQVRELMVQREMQVRVPEYLARIGKEAGLVYSAAAPRRLPVP